MMPMSPLPECVSCPACLDMRQKHIVRKREIGGCCLCHGTLFVPIEWATRWYEFEARLLRINRNMSVKARTTGHGTTVGHKRRDDPSMAGNPYLRW